MINTINDLKAQLEGIGQDKAWAVITEAEYTERSAPIRKQLIQALNDQIEKHRQEMQAGEITKSQFGILRGAILAEIDVWDTRPNCTFSAWPNPDESKLRVRKGKARRVLDERKEAGKIGNAAWARTATAISQAKTEAELNAIVELDEIKFQVQEAIAPYLPNIGSKGIKDLQVELLHAHDSAAVENIYSDWQDRLRLKQIAQLPDLHQKPATRNKAA